MKKRILVAVGIIACVAVILGMPVKNTQASPLVYNMSIIHLLKVLKHYVYTYHIEFYYNSLIDSLHEPLF